MHSISVQKAHVEFGVSARPPHEEGGAWRWAAGARPRHKGVGGVARTADGPPAVHGARV